MRVCTTCRLYRGCIILSMDLRNTGMLKRWRNLLCIYQVPSEPPSRNCAMRATARRRRGTRQARGAENTRRRERNASQSHNPCFFSRHPQLSSKIPYSCSHQNFMPKSRPTSRLQLFKDHVSKMAGEEITPKFETLQLHAGRQMHGVANDVGLC